MLVTAVVDLDVCLAEVSTGDGDKMFRLARCRVRCLASLQVRSYLVPLTDLSLRFMQGAYCSFIEWTSYALQYCPTGRVKLQKL